MRERSWPLHGYVNPAPAPSAGQQTINSPNLVPVALHPIFPHSFARWLVENRGNLRKSPCARPVAAPQVCEKCNSLGVAIEGRRRVLQRSTPQARAALGASTALAATAATATIAMKTTTATTLMGIPALFAPPPVRRPKPR